MKLEVISHIPTKSNSHPPLLLVHGAWAGAWVWQGSFFEYFAEQGWEVHAMSLRGHGKSEGHERIRSWRIADYVEDVAQVADSLGRQPVLVGHSMGGFVTQKYLESHTAAGAVLLASVPAKGIGGFQFRYFLKHPLTWLWANLTMSTIATIPSTEAAWEWFFDPSLPRATVEAQYSQFAEDSYRAALEMLLSLPKPERVKTPVAVVGGGIDRAFPPAEQRQTAQAYGVEAKIFAKTAHTMMLGPEWQDVAAWITEWAAGLAADTGQSQRP